jgi:integrase
MVKTNLAVMPEPRRKAGPKRRARRGRGSIFFPKYTVTLPDGTKQSRTSQFAWIRYTDETGQRHNEKTNFTTKAGAEQHLTDRLSRIDKGEFDLPEQRRLTLHDMLELVRIDYEQNKRTTIKKLERSIGRLEEFFGASTRILSITNDDTATERYRTHRLAQPDTSFATVNRELAALRAAYYLAQATGKVQRIPNIVIQNEDTQIRDGEFSKEQEKDLLAELPAFLVPVVKFIFRTGMRISEPLSLRWEHVNLDKGELRIPGRFTKNKKQKVLFLTGKPFDILKEQAKATPKSPFIFPDPEGNGELGYDKALWHFQHAAQKAKIIFAQDGERREPGFHDIRRTFARRADRSGVSHKLIMEIAGWKTYAMLLRYLGEASREGQHAAFNKMEGD